MLITKKLTDFLDETASSAPAPGGGSASALAGALGTALSEMVINLTVGKKKYLNVSTELAEMLPELALIRKELQQSIDLDSDAFNEVMASFRLPKETDEQKSSRRKEIQLATLKATQVPLDVMQNALKAMQLTLPIALKGNKNSISDAGVASLLLANAIDGAAYNVKINLPGLPSDLPFRKEAEAKLIQIDSKKTKLAIEIAQAVEENL